MFLFPVLQLLLQARYFATEPSVSHRITWTLISGQCILFLVATSLLARKIRALIRGRCLENGLILGLFEETSDSKQEIILPYLQVARGYWFAAFFLTSILNLFPMLVISSYFVGPPVFVRVYFWIVAVCAVPFCFDYFRMEKIRSQCLELAIGEINDKSTEDFILWARANKLDLRNNWGQVLRVLRLRSVEDELALRAYADREVIQYRPYTREKLQNLEVDLQTNLVSTIKLRWWFFLVLAGVFLPVGLSPRPGDVIGIGIVCLLVMGFMLVLFAKERVEIKRKQFRALLIEFSDSEIEDLQKLLGPRGNKIASFVQKKRRDFRAKLHRSTSSGR